MEGSRINAFPRHYYFCYYVYFAGFIMLYVAFMMNIGPYVGWFAYFPLAGPDYSPGKRADFWAQMITFTELSALCTATCLIITILKHKAPGMTLNRMPMILWEKLTVSMMVIFAMPAVMLASSMLLLDR